MADDPYMQDAKRLADHSYPDLQQITADFNRPTLGDFAGFAVVVAAVGVVVVSGLYFLLWILT
jgi:hypothetical protein